MTDDSRVAELRQLFPVVRHWTYLFNGGIHPCPRPVAEAMRSFLEEWENGGEAACARAFESFARLKEKFAKLIHTSAKNIVITESTTAGINMAAQIISPRTGQNVVVTDLAFSSDTYPWLASQSAATDVRFVKSRDGKIYMEDLAEQVNEQTAAVTICAVTFGSGFRYNLPEVYAITSKYDVPLIVDGSQALGVVDINANEPPLSFLASTASKWLMGPTGVGFLYVADRYLSATPPHVGWLSVINPKEWDASRCQLREDAMRFQGGVPNLIGVVGALMGLELLEQVGREFIEERVRQLTTYTLDELGKIGVSIWTPRADKERAGIVFFRPPNPQELHDKLKAARIYCGCFLGGIRIDPNFYNTYVELDKFLAIVRSHMVRNSTIKRFFNESSWVTTVKEK